MTAGRGRHFGRIAQTEEQRFCESPVVGSTPTLTSGGASFRYGCTHHEASA